MKYDIPFAAVLLISTLIAGGLMLAWWGWHTLDSTLLLLGSRLC
ncbi:hypothetical protein [Vreelandella alkaliphila]|nr:hypothetical protein [Halomonas alkaliphila]